jgi:hypothetical protein
MEKENQKDDLSKKDIEQLDKIIDKLLSVKRYINKQINYLFFKL